MAKSPKTTSPRDGSNLQLSAPWGERCARYLPGIVALQEGKYLSGDEVADFVKARSDVHALYLRETERTRRLGMWLAASLLALACLIPVFAPAGREAMSQWIAFALFVFSAGSMGYTSIKYASEKRQLAVTKVNQDA